MLTKLIGYEMKAFGRIILPLYAATLGMALLIGLGVRFLPEKVYSNFFGATVIMIFAILIISTMVMTGILCVQRFYQNLLGNEGYLMFSLPAGTHQLILSKVVASLIWTVLGGVTAVCTGLILVFTTLPIRSLFARIREFGLAIDPQTLFRDTGTFVSWTVVSILLFTAMLMQIYAALAIGHQWSSHRILGSVLAYFGIDIIKSTVNGLLVNIGVQSGLMGVAMMHSVRDRLVPIQIMSGGLALVLIAIFSFVTWYFLDKKLNLE